MRWLTAKIVVLVFAVMCGSFVQEAYADPSINEQPAVIKAVAPIYPPIAAAVNAEGKVIVDVKINSGGEVTSAKGRGGLPVFKATAENAASHWRFAEDSAAIKERVAQLEFTFKIVENARDAGVSFTLPYQVEISNVHPEIEDINLN